MIDLDKIRRSADIIGESVEIQEMLALIGQVANTDILVLITGESGAGKIWLPRQSIRTAAENLKK